MLIAWIGERSGLSVLSQDARFFFKNAGHLLKSHMRYAEMDRAFEKGEGRASQIGTALLFGNVRKRSFGVA